MSDAMSERFAGKTAIVTGGAQGIGGGIARRLVAEGANVVVADIDDGMMSAICSELGDTVSAVKTDVTDERQVEALVAHAVERHGRLDAAFNVAGNARRGTITEQSEEGWDYTVDLCLKGVFLCVKHQARQMLKQPEVGSIVNMASLNSEVPMIGGAAYCSSKAGVEMLSRCAALEFGRSGLRVNSISPGLINTRIAADTDKVPGLLDAFLRHIPLDRRGDPGDVAGPALFLASDDARYVTGVNLLVDGGWSLTTFPDLSGFTAEFGA